jgi:hypothetical protein
MLFLAPFPYPEVSETSELWSEYSFRDRQEGLGEPLELNAANQVRVGVLLSRPAHYYPPIRSIFTDFFSNRRQMSPRKYSNSLHDEF